MAIPPGVLKEILNGDLREAIRQAECFLHEPEKYGLAREKVDAYREALIAADTVALAAYRVAHSLLGD